MFIKILNTIYNTNDIAKVHPVDQQENNHVVQIDFCRIKSSGETRKYKFATQAEADDFFLDIENKLIP